MRSGKHRRVQEAGENHPRRGIARALADDALRQTQEALLRAGFSDPALVLRWAEIAGAAVARVAAPVSLKEDRAGATLTLRSEPAAAVFLQHETRALIERLNAFLGRGRIRRIRFVPGPVASPPESVNPVSRLPSEPANPAPKGLGPALERFSRVRAQKAAKGSGAKGAD